MFLLRFNRDWVLADSETKLKLYFRNFYHVFGSSLNTSFLFKTLISVYEDACPIQN